MKYGIVSLNSSVSRMNSAMVNHNEMLKQILIKLGENGLDFNDLTPQTIQDVFPVLDSIPLMIWITDRIKPVYLNTKGRAYYNFTMAQIKKEKSGIYSHFLLSDTFHKINIGGHAYDHKPEQATEAFFKISNGKNEVKWIGNIAYQLSHNIKSEYKYMLHLSYDADEYLGKVMSMKDKYGFSEENTPTLTEKEYEVLTLICQEFTSKEIAGKLFISTETVNYHRKNLMVKLDAQSSIGVAMKALQYNLI